MEETERFSNLVRYMEDNFSELESMVAENLGERDGDYQSICEKLRNMIREYPFIIEITEGTGDITLSADEHRILSEFFKADLEKEEMERKQLYFQGHMDGYAYMKKIGAVDKCRGDGGVWCCKILC